MAVTVRNILQLESCKRMKLVAGEKALDKALTWPYIKTMDTFSEWIDGGEIVFVIGNKGETGEEELITLLNEAKKAKVNALVMLTDAEHVCRFSRNVVHQANISDVVLLKLPFQQKLIDITKEISTLLMEDKLKNVSSDFRDAESVVELLLMKREINEVLQYCYHRLQPLLSIDQVVGSELVWTWYEYLINGCDALHTSRKMYLHRNTLLGRLKKIKQALNVDINDPMIHAEFLNVYTILKDCGIKEWMPGKEEKNDNS